MGRSISAPRREANGRLKRPTLAQIKAAEREREDVEKATVLAQPHRLGDMDQKLESALGRFVVRNRLRSELYVAGTRLFVLVWSWRAAVGAPMPLHIPRESLLVSDGPGKDKVWQRKINGCQRAIARVCGPGAWRPVSNLCVHDWPALDADKDIIVQGLSALAVEFGLVDSRGFVPFLVQSNG